MKKQIKAPKIKLGNGRDSQPIRCRIQNAGNQDVQVEYGCKIEEKVKAMKSEIKENVQGTNSEGKKTRTQIFGLEQKEEINIQPEQNEETRIQNNEERLRNLWDNFKHSNIWITEVPEGEEEEKETENLIEKNNKGELLQSG